MEYNSTNNNSKPNKLGYSNKHNLFIFFKTQNFIAIYTKSGITRIATLRFKNQ